MYLGYIIVKQLSRRYCLFKKPLLFLSTPLFLLNTPLLLLDFANPLFFFLSLPLELLLDPLFFLEFLYKVLSQPFTYSSLLRAPSWTSLL
jgi:hypothetical protein